MLHCSTYSYESLRPLGIDIEWPGHTHPECPKEKMTPNQINVLKYLIIRSKDCGILTKKLALLLIDESQGFTREVYATIIQTPRAWKEPDVRALGAGFHDMRSCNGTTHVNEVMVGMGANMFFDSHIGVLCGDGEIRNFPNGIQYTIWLSDIAYSRTATRVHVSRKTLNAVSLEEPRIEYLQRPHGTRIPARVQ